MRFRNRRQHSITALGRYWDALVQGRPAGPGDLDPALAETVHRLQARDDAPGADPAFAARLLEQLEDHMDTIPLGAIAPGTSIRSDAMPGPNGRRPASPLSPPLVGEHPARRWPVPLAPAVSAALVVITLLLAIVVFGPPRFGDQNEQLTGGTPAIVAPGTPAPATPTAGGTDDETLTTVTLPAGLMPRTVIGGLNHYTIPAGTEGTWDWTCCNGVRLNYILEGTITIRGAGPMQVQRAGAPETWEEIAPDTEIELSVGDALWSRMKDNFDAANPGPATVELLDVVLFRGDPLDDPVPYDEAGTAAWQYNDQDIWFVPIPLPEESPVTLWLREATIPATSAMPAPSDALLQLAITRQEGAIPSTQPDFSIRNYGPDPIAVYALSMSVDNATAAGTPMP